LSIEEAFLQVIDLFPELPGDFFEALESIQLASDLCELEFASEPVLHESHLLGVREVMSTIFAVLLDNLFNDFVVDWADPDEVDNVFEAVRTQVLVLIDK